MAKEQAAKEPPMGAPYAQDLRDRVLGAYDRGMQTKQIADVFQVSAAWARRIKQRRRETGQTTPRPMGGATIVKIDATRLAELVREQPDATAKQSHQRLGVDCVESAVGMALKRLGLEQLALTISIPTRFEVVGALVGTDGIQRVNNRIT